MMTNDLLLLVSKRLVECSILSLFFFSIIYLTFVVLEGVNLLLKHRNISQPNLVQLPLHLVTSPNCQCRRSFHIFCTDLLDKNGENTDMINVHPAPRTHDRDLSRRVPTPYRKYRHPHQKEYDQETIITARSEPPHAATAERHTLEKQVIFFSMLHK